MDSFFTSNFETNDNRIIRRLILLNFILLMGFLTFLSFSLFNYFITQDYTIMFMNIVTTLVTAGVFADLHLNRNLERASYLAIACYFIFLLFFVSANQNSSFGLVWTLFMPVVIVGLIGAHRGSIVTLVYFLILFVLAYKGVGVWDNGTWDLISFFRLVFASFLMLFLIMIFDIALEHSSRMLETMSSTDALTSLYNRRKMLEIIKREVDRSRRYQKALSVILFDIDDFKHINDRYGHQGGDRVLVKLSRTVTENLRSSDYIARWGGEEFLIVCPETASQEALIIAEKLRHTIETMPCEERMTISCSFGVVTFEKEKDNIDSFIHRADMAMYRAKEHGKNCVSS